MGLRPESSCVVDRLGRDLLATGTADRDDSERRDAQPRAGP